MEVTCGAQVPDAIGRVGCQVKAGRAVWVAVSHSAPSKAVAA